MVNKKRKKSNSKSVIIIIILTILVIAGFFLLFSNPKFWFKKSIHEDAKSYSTRHCLVFYPNNDKGRKIAKEIAKDIKEDSVYDYSLVPCGDYYLVNYGNGYEYYIDKNYNSISINGISDNGKKIIADYLRYNIKKYQPDKYYDSKFIEETYIDNLDFTGVTYDIKNENLLCRFPNYDVDVLVPFRYMQKEIGMNFGYNDEQYVKPTYIDSNHPVICLTFDDGPNLWDSIEDSSSVSIVDTLSRYDATATFYVCGYTLEERNEWSDYQLYSFLKRSIENGNEYGSHTDGHDFLLDISTADGIKKTILYPAEILKDIVDYDMVTYRPPGGSFDDNVLNAQPYPAILWDADSDDWDLKNSEDICNRVLDKYEYYDGDIILFHDIYDETAEAIKKIIPALIDKGYQLVTVKDMLQYSDIDVNKLKYYYNLNPSPYYE